MCTFRKFAGPRLRYDTIFNRLNHNLLIYVFLNGDGLKPQHVNFTKSQTELGMKSVLEVVAKKFDIAPSKYNFHAFSNTALDWWIWMGRKFDTFMS